MSIRACLVVLLSCCSVGCGSTTSPVAEEGSFGGAPAAGAPSNEAGVGSGGAWLGGSDAAGDAPGGACERVDILISVDGSGSMTEELEALRSQVFPELAKRLTELGQGLQDFRVGVIDACPTPANLHVRGNALPDCQFSTGKSWMDHQSPKLVDEFACVGDLYVDDTLCSGDDDDEQPASSAAAALVDPVNAGFLRDDALLVVMAVTDEDEQPHPKATPQELHDRLVAVKGSAEWVVFLGVGGTEGCNGAYGHAAHANRLQEVTALFGDRGVFWDLCNGKLEDGLAAAVGSIQSACVSTPR